MTLKNLFRQKNNRKRPSRAMVEPLETRSLLAATPGPFTIAFYGLGGAGGFSTDWFDKAIDDAGKVTGSVVRKYNYTDRGSAVKDLFRAIDTNHNKIIEGREVKPLTVRVVGYSLGAIEATNLTRQVVHVGDTFKGYFIKNGVPIRQLVTYDPVPNSLAASTTGVPAGVARFANYYQQRGGDTTIDLYTATSPSFKIDTLKVDDPLDIKGTTLHTEARSSKQIRIDVGPYQDVTVTHRVYSGVNGKIKGRNVNHGTIPFFVYDFVVDDLVKL